VEFNSILIDKKNNNWVKLSVNVSEEFVEPVVQMFSKFLSGNVFIENIGDPEDKIDGNVWVAGFKEKSLFTSSIEHNLRSGLLLFSGVFDISDLSISEIDSAMWEKQHFDPIFVSKDVVVLPNKDELDKYKDIIWVVIEPSMAFGTGHHPTTKMCLNYLKKYVIKNSSVLDLGCGSGILGISALKMGAANCLSIDVEEESVKATIKNSIDSNVKGKIISEKQNLLNSINLNFIPDLIIANLNAFLFREGISNISSLLKGDSKMIASGILIENLDQITDILKSGNLEIIEKETSGDWAALVLKKGLDA
jgi:ribosomal protein L11 methyltransferase